MSLYGRRRYIFQTHICKSHLSSVIILPQKLPQALLSGPGILLVLSVNCLFLHFHIIILPRWVWGQATNHPQNYSLLPSSSHDEVIPFQEVKQTSPVLCECFCQLLLTFQSKSLLLLRPLFLGFSGDLTPGVSLHTCSSL